MEYLDRMRHIACRLSLNKFVAAHDGLYALGSYPGPSSDDGLQWSFTTQPNANIAEKFAEALADGGAALLAGRFLHKIEKSDRNPWKGRLSVGRAKNSDVIIRHPSVSKLHAHFLTPPGADPKRDNEYTIALADAGSSNGTRLNGLELVDDTEHPVRPGDRIIFGEVTCEILDPVALYHKMRALFPTEDLGPMG